MPASSSCDGDLWYLCHRAVALPTTCPSTSPPDHRCSTSFRRATFRRTAEGQDEIVYLVTSIDRVVEEHLRFVFTDRNAALGFARYGDELQDLDDYVDWELMEGRVWHDTTEEPDRQERRMAEFLVHGHVPWSALVGVAACTDEVCRQAEHALGSVGSEILIRPRPEWYF